VASTDDSTPHPDTGAGFRRVLAKLGVDLRRGEAAIAFMLFAFFAAAITFQYISKPVRQSVFITSLGADKLPIVYLVLAVCAIPVILLYNRAVDRLQRHHVIAATCFVVATSVVGFSFVIHSEAAWVPIAFYVWISIAYVMIVSQFWAYSNYVLNPRQGKRMFGFIGAGGPAGGLTGALLAGYIADVAGTRAAVLVSAGILFAAIPLLYIIHYIAGSTGAVDEERPRADKLAQSKGGWEAIRGSRHLQLIAALMFITVVVANIVDFQFNWAMDEAIIGEGRLDDLTGGFGDFYAIMNVSALIFQLAFTSRIHRKLGVGFAMRVLPVAMAIGTTGLVISARFIPRIMLGVCGVLKVGENGIRYTLDQATRELLFFPVPATDRVKSKAYIDVFVQRSGKLGAGLLLLPVVFGWMSPVDAAWMSFALIAVWLVITVAVRRQYVVSFRDGLRRRAVDAEIPHDLTDITGLEVLVEALASTDPRQVIHSLGVLDYFGKGQLIPPLLLRHENAEVRHKTLELMQKYGRTDAIPLIEEAMGDPEAMIRSSALQSLVALRADTATTEFVERLSDGDVGVRGAAIASVLTHDGSVGRDEARSALKAMVGAAEPSVRCAATDVIGALREPDFQEDLVQLLYDSELAVQRDAIHAVRTRVERGGNNPIFVPTLISLLRDRRLKHPAREALVSYGDSIIPALVHFMTDPEEQLLVRRAVPMTVARIGDAAAAEALLGSLDADDRLMRREAIEALTRMRTQDPDLRFDDKIITRQLRREAQIYFLSFADLASITPTETLQYRPPFVDWGDTKPVLLQRMLADRMRTSVANLLGLLALVHPAADVHAAAENLLRGDARLRSNALEYLDNALSGDIRRYVFAVIGDAPLQNKLETAHSTFDVTVPSREDLLLRLVLASRTPDETARWLGMAAIEAIYALELSDLYTQLIEASRRAEDSVVKETAIWAIDRLGLASA